jgi:hypothetical protein
MQLPREHVPGVTGVPSQFGSSSRGWFMVTTARTPSCCVSSSMWRFSRSGNAPSTTCGSMRLHHGRVWILRSAILYRSDTWKTYRVYSRWDQTSVAPRFNPADTYKVLIRRWRRARGHGFHGRWREHVACSGLQWRCAAAGGGGGSTGRHVGGKNAFSHARRGVEDRRDSDIEDLSTIRLG